MLENCRQSNNDKNLYNAARNKAKLNSKNACHRYIVRDKQSVAESAGTIVRRVLNALINLPDAKRGAIRKGTFWLRATSQIWKESPQRTNRLERERVGLAFGRYRVIDSLAKRSLRFPRVF